MAHLFARKPLNRLMGEAQEIGEHTLKRSLGPTNLVMLGIGAIIGAGLFVRTAAAIADRAGPSVVLAFVVAGVGCAFAGLCYAEFASMIPVAGSAYTYSYATMGEFVAWIIGWDLVLEYAMGAATVGVGWSGHFLSLLDFLGIHVPAKLTQAPFDFCTQGEFAAKVAGCTQAGWFGTGAYVNLPAIFIVALMSYVLVVGIKQSATVNNVIVITKVTIVLAVIVFGLQYVNPDNWKPFIPPNTGEWGTYGWSGVLRGASLIFFTYIGFDAVSTAAQESRNPQKDMPIGILGSLAVCTLLYVLMSATLTGLVSYKELNVAAPVALAVSRIPQLNWLRPFIDVGAVMGLASVILVMLLGQSRVFYSMSRDGLLGAWAGKVHPTFRTPYLSTIYTGFGVAFFTGLFPIRILGQLVNIGTLLAFVLVCFGVWILRHKRPDLDRPFRTPFVPIVPILGIATCLALMGFLPMDTWIRLFVWLVIGFGIYFGYSRKHSVLQRELAGLGRTR